jgi:hypothetical protein
MEDAGKEELSSTIPALACRYMKKNVVRTPSQGSIPKTGETEIERGFLEMQDAGCKIQDAG